MFCSLGKPLPRIDWYLEEKLMYGESESRSSRVTVKRLTIPTLSRDYQNKKLSCHASNTNLVPPATKSIILDINRKYKCIFFHSSSFNHVVIITLPSIPINIRIINPGRRLLFLAVWCWVPLIYFTNNSPPHLKLKKKLKLHSR